MKKIIIIFLAVLCVVLLLFLAFRAHPANKGGAPKPSPVPTPFPSLYRGLAPGVSTESDAVATLGNPVRKDESPGGATLVYSSGLENQPVNIDMTKDGVVYRIYEPVSSALRYADLTKNLGPPDLVLYGRFERQGFRLFVFLGRGLALLANPQTQEVKERWYFPQTDPDTFRRVIAPNMSLESTLGQQ